MFKMNRDLNTFRLTRWPFTCYFRFLHSAHWDIWLKKRFVSFYGFPISIKIICFLLNARMILSRNQWAKLSFTSLATKSSWCICIFWPIFKIRVAWQSEVWLSWTGQHALNSIKPFIIGSTSFTRCIIAKLFTFTVNYTGFVLFK